jgi:hypothetical protein
VVPIHDHNEHRKKEKIWKMDEGEVERLSNFTCFVLRS